MQSDGKIVAAGISSSGSSNLFAIVRYNVDGLLDTSFKGTGKVTTTLGIDAAGANLAVQRDQKLIVAGYSDNDFAATRYLSAPLAAPTVRPTAASGIERRSAQFNGTVNARGLASTVRFEYGTDGNSFPNTVAAVPGVVTESEDTAVSAAAAPLDKGTVYHYRITATTRWGRQSAGRRLLLL